VGEVIAKLAEDAYFMRVDNRVSQVPPLRITKPTMKAQVAVQRTMDATALKENYRRTPTALGHQLVDLLRAATMPAALAVVAPRRLMVMLAGEAAVAGAPHTGAGRRAGGGGDCGGRGHADSHVTGVSRDGYDARRKIE
jgi:hypothetical protein